MHVFSGLGSLIEKPMFLDTLTTSQLRVAFVRICVEIKTDEIPLIASTTQMKMGTIVLRKLSTSGPLKLCFNCKTFGPSYNSKWPKEKMTTIKGSQSNTLEAKSFQNQQRGNIQDHTWRIHGAILEQG